MSSSGTTTPIWDHFDTIPSFSPVDKIHMRLLAGEQIMMNMVDIKPGGVVPEHSHPNEQTGYVISGTLILTLNGETRRLGPGSCYVVPSAMLHSGTTDEHGCTVMDIFAPPRADYVALQERARTQSTGEGDS